MVRNRKLKIIIRYVVGPLLGAWLFYSLYQQIRGQPHLRDSLVLMKDAPFGKSSWKFWLVILLALVNWGIEARKWQVLLKPLQAIGFLRAYRSVLSGLALSLNTPNRMGEYGGRILYVKEGSRLKAISLSIAGSISQLIITLALGCGGLVYLIYFSNLQTEYVMGLSLYWIKFLLLISSIITGFLILFFFRLSWLIKLLEKIPYSSRFTQYLNVLEQFTAKILLRLLSLSFFRYLVFVLQYILLLQLLHVEIFWFDCFWIISILFLVLAIVPSFAIADLGIRGKF